MRPDQINVELQQKIILPLGGSASQLKLKNLEIISHPTGNCQLCCMSYFGNFFNEYKPSNQEEVNTFRRKLKEIIFISSQQNILLLDIKQSIYESTKELELFREATINELPYKSTNGSQMVILLIEVNKL